MGALVLYVFCTIMHSPTNVMLARGGVSYVCPYIVQISRYNRNVESFVLLVGTFLLSSSAMNQELMVETLQEVHISLL